MHQQCYGLVKVPKGDWICDLCLYVGSKGKYLRCPLCTKRGGAMKPTVLWADTQHFASLNPEFHEFLSQYAHEDRIARAKAASTKKLAPSKAVPEKLSKSTEKAFKS